MTLTDTEQNLIDFEFVKRLPTLHLSRREKEILIQLALGKKNREISEKLGVTASTIRNHVSNIFSKLKITNRAQATAIAIFCGLLTEESFTEETKFLYYSEDSCNDVAPENLCIDSSACWINR